MLKFNVLFIFPSLFFSNEQIVLRAMKKKLFIPRTSRADAAAAPAAPHVLLMDLAGVEKGHTATTAPTPRWRGQRAGSHRMNTQTRDSLQGLLKKPHV